MAFEKILENGFLVSTCLKKIVIFTITFLGICIPRDGSGGILDDFVFFLKHGNASETEVKMIIHVI